MNTLVHLTVLALVVYLTSALDSPCGIPANDGYLSCKELNEKITNSKAFTTYTPQCKKDGSFEPIQCNGSTGYCCCVDKNGQPKGGAANVRAPNNSLPKLNCTNE